MLLFGTGRDWDQLENKKQSQAQDHSLTSRDCNDAANHLVFCTEVYNTVTNMMVPEKMITYLIRKLWGVESPKLSSTPGILEFFKIELP